MELETDLTRRKRARTNEKNKFDKKKISNSDKNKKKLEKKKEKNTNEKKLTIIFY